MSSYQENAYFIEHRRLQMIAEQCEQELNEIISALDKKKCEIRNAPKTFQEKMIQGQKEQEKSDKEREGYDRAVLETMQRQTQNQIFENMVQDEIIRNKQNESFQYRVRIGKKNKERRKGVSLYIENKNQDETDDLKNIKKKFEDRLGVAKNLNECHLLVSEIEREYYEQPEFARPLYAQQKINELDKLIQEEKQQTSSETDIRRQQIILRYCALKKLLTEKEGSEDDSKKIDFDRVSVAALEQQCRKMENQLIEIKKQEYIADALEKVMKKHDISFLNVQKEKNYGQYDENLDFHIFGLTQNKFIMEVEGKYKGSSPTLDEKRKSVTSAKKVCGLFKIIHEELEREYGIVFENISVTQPSEQSIIMKPSTEVNNGRKVQKNHMSQRTLQYSSEGK